MSTLEVVFGVINGRPRHCTWLSTQRFRLWRELFSWRLPPLPRRSGNAPRSQAAAPAAADGKAATTPADATPDGRRRQRRRNQGRSAGRTPATTAQLPRRTTASKRTRRQHQAATPPPHRPPQPPTPRPRPTPSRAPEYCASHHRLVCPAGNCRQLPGQGCGCRTTAGRSPWCLARWRHRS